MDRIFISYSRHDQQFVDKLVDDLRQQGGNVWLDRENIAPGSNWQQQIERGLSESSVLLFVITRHSIKSAWMVFEASTFLQKGKRIIPIKLDDVPVDSLPKFLAEIQWVNFHKSYAEGIQLLVNSLDLRSSIAASRPTRLMEKKNLTKGYAFLSYAEEDRDFIKWLKVYLRKHRYAYWDYDESDRDYHSQLFLELEGVIQEASATLSVLSESWKQSPWTVKEFFFSQEVQIPVFLLKAKPLGATLAIAGLPYIDFTIDKKRAFGKLDRELKRKKL